MQGESSIRRVAVILAASLLVTGVTGCKKSTEDTTCIGTRSDYVCVTKRPSDSSAPPSSGSTTSGSALTAVSDYEPNNTLANANVIQFGVGGADRAEINGSVSTVSDPADFFVFTPSRTDKYGVYICAESCTEFMQTDGLYLMVYDQSQTTIAGTPVGTVASQEIAVDLSAGLAYYVEVNGYNTGDDGISYRMIITD